MQKKHILEQDSTVG